jgi:23S rRNA pseudouridine2605 synthase
MRTQKKRPTTSTPAKRYTDRKADRNAERKPDRFAPKFKAYSNTPDEETASSFSKKRVGKSLVKPKEDNKRPAKRFSSQRPGTTSCESKPYSDKAPQRKCVLVKKQPTKIDDGKIRLNRYLANSGVCSRREADEYISAGVVRVNDTIISELGYKVSYDDKVYFHNDLIRPEKKTYILLNKPKNCVTTSDDPQERLTVLDLVKTATNDRVYPVGRLDRNTTGVLLLTNDGDLASKLTHPKYNKKKIYHVGLDKPLTREHFDKIKTGLELEDGLIEVDELHYLEDMNDELGVEIHSGRNRIVRRIFESLGYKVVKLDRVYFCGLTKKKISRGKWRFLSQMEINMLKMGSFE